jgi:hypothetical protein
MAAYYHPENDNGMGKSSCDRSRVVLRVITLRDY